MSDKKVTFANADESLSVAYEGGYQEGYKQGKKDALAKSLNPTRTRTLTRREKLEGAREIWLEYNPDRDGNDFDEYLEEQMKK